MNSRVRRSLTAGAAAVLGSIVLASSTLSASLSWSTPTTLDERRGVYLADAAFVDGSVAVLWGRPNADAPDVRVKSSTDGGNSFSRMTVFHGASWGAVAICDGQVNVALVRKANHGRSAVDVAFGPVGSAEYAQKRVIAGRPDLGAPDIACAGGRVFISWYERDGGPFRRFVAHALLSTHKFGEPIDLGLDRTNYDGYYAPRGLAIAAAANTAYAVYGAQDGQLRIKRWSIDDLPDHSLRPHPVEVLAPGSNRCPAGSPVIGADGATVAVAWERNANILVRVSTSRGASWRRIRGLDNDGCGGIVDGAAWPGSIAVAGQRMIVEVGSCGFGFCGATAALTDDSFAHYSYDTLWSGREQSSQSHVVGYATLHGQTRLADAYGNGRRIRFRHER